ncbi:MAG: Uma2 family endonuclease [Gemmataceae bacterium]|nr:Uma2 family endonuclease [Gemmataceae bacterium]
MSTATLPPPAPKPTPAAPREHLLTAADLAVLPTRLPSGYVKYELNDGRLVVMPPPGNEHGRRQQKVARFLDTEGEEKGLGEVWAEVGIVLRRDPDRVVGADCAFVLAESLPVRESVEGYLETIPELVVEVRSKNDTGPEEAAKRDEYFAAGVKLVWAVDPAARTVTAHQPGQPDQVFAEADTLTCPLIPGFAVPVARLFVGRRA